MSPTDLMLEQAGFLPAPLKHELEELRSVLFILGYFDGFSGASFGFYDFRNTEGEMVYNRIVELIKLNNDRKSKWMMTERLVQAEQHKRFERMKARKMKRGN